MKKGTLLAGVITASLLSTTAALADDGKINFIGSITDTACTVVNSVTNPLTVTLGTVSRTALDGAAGKTAAPTDFKILLTSCPATLNGHTATVKFDGVSANSNNSALKLTQDTGVATGVGIQISDNTGAVVPLYTPSSAYNLVTGDNSLDFVARYLAVANTVTAGPANSTSNFTIIYN